MEYTKLQNIVVALGSLWIVHSSIFKAAEFVNALRDDIIVGYRGSIRLTFRHRIAMRFDWMLSMATTVVVATLFGGLLWVLAEDQTLEWGKPMASALRVLSGFSFVCGLGFILCGISDLRVMNVQLEIDKTHGWDRVDR